MTSFFILVGTVVCLLLVMGLAFAFLRELARSLFARWDEDDDSWMPPSEH